MKTRTVSKAKAGGPIIARQIINPPKNLLVQTSAGCIGTIPCDIPAHVSPAEKGDFRYSENAIRQANTFGETL
ncbi:hypothetical protein OPIT5_02170 [Opitutaceae bacterium TAV5]|nr:hypothetical protein OPIT5_02170 [Opitutaceae bacterium TAV5]